MVSLTVVVLIVFVVFIIYVLYRIGLKVKEREKALKKWYIKQDAQLKNVKKRKNQRTPKVPSIKK